MSCYRTCITYIALCMQLFLYFDTHGVLYHDMILDHGIYYRIAVSICIAEPYLSMVYTYRNLLYFCCEVNKFRMRELYENSCIKILLKIKVL